MPKKVALITVHGMGETQPNYNAELVSQLKRRLGSASADLHIGSVYYQGILQPNERRVWRQVEGRLAGQWDWMRRAYWNELRRFFLYGFGDAAGLENGKESRSSVYTQAQVCFAKALFAARQAMEGDGPVVIIAQSLGCQVASCYFWDAQQKANGASVNVGIWTDIRLFEREITGTEIGQGTPEKGRPLSPEEISFLQGKSFKSFITTGCNIPIFVAAHAKADIVPIFSGSNEFCWHNYYDKDDVLGWPLGPLSSGYDKRVIDHPINASGSFWGWLALSWNPMSHTQYWGDNDVLSELETQLGQLLEISDRSR